MRPTPWKPLAIVTSLTTILLSLLLLPACCCRSRQASAPVVAPRVPPPVDSAPLPVPTAAQAKRPVDATMFNVDFHADETTMLRIHELRAEMVAKDPGRGYVDFNDKRAFTLRIDSGRIGVTMPSLDTLMNRYVFGYPGAPLRDLHVTTAGAQLRIEGIMHKLIDIPFTMLADVSVTGDGKIRLHATRVDICGINGLKLLQAVGQNLEKMLDLSKAKGVQAQGNDLILDPLSIVPAPAIEGRIVDARVDGDELMQTFDAHRNLPPLIPPNRQSPNYMYFHGGTLRIGKLLMVDADMQVIDTDATDPFDFFIDRYNEQLVEGYSRNQPNYALVVHMRDFSDLGLPCRAGEHGFC